MEQAHRQLLCQAAWSELQRCPGFAGATPSAKWRPLSEQELTRLLRGAFEQASSSEPATKQAAFETVARVLLCFAKPPNHILDMAAAAFARLGYFRAIEVLEAQHDAWTPFLPLAIRTEAATRLIRNSLDESLTEILTDFQRDFLLATRRHPHAAYSAPTSAGKSFVLARIVRSIAKLGNQTLVYLVPTRALIREVSARIRTDLRNHGIRNIPIRTVPVPLPDNAKAIYVLTQERLLGLLRNDRGITVPIDVLIVDEAHEIASGSRGVLLEAAVDEVRYLNPTARIYYASPSINNPEYFLAMGSAPKREGLAAIERRSPVLHTNWLVKPKTQRIGNTYHYRIELDVTDGETDHQIGVMPLDGKPPKTNPEQLAWVGRMAHQAGATTIIYGNTRPMVEKQAKQLAATQATPKKVPEQLESLAAYVTEQVHPRHPLANQLRRKVATHHGSMPQSVRMRVEELAAKGDLDFVCCTSTLLQGVNIPCRNIVLLNPCRDQEPLNATDLRNLAGRSGRLDSDFRGNTWIVSPDKWNSETYRDHDLSTIKSTFQAEMEAGAPSIQKLLQGPIRSTDELRDASANLGHAFQLISGQTRLELYQTNSPEAAANLEKVIADVKHLVASIKVPPELVRRHPSFDPRTLQTLFSNLAHLAAPTANSEQSAEFERWLPTAEKIDDHHQYAYLQFTLDELSKIFDQQFTMETARKNYLKFQVFIANLWLKGLPLRPILEKQCNYKAEEEGKNPDDPDFVGGVVRDTIQTIEDDIQYRMVEQFRVLGDILHYLLRDNPQRQQELLPIHTYLEFGTRNTKLTHIIGLGLTRATAILLRDALDRLEFTYTEPEEILDYLQQLPAETIADWQFPPEAWLELCHAAGRPLDEVDWSRPPSTA